MPRPSPGETGIPSIPGFQFSNPSRPPLYTQRLSCKPFFRSFHPERIGQLLANSASSAPEETRKCLLVSASFYRRHRGLPRRRENGSGLSDRLTPPPQWVGPARAMRSERCPLSACRTAILPGMPTLRPVMAASVGFRRLAVCRRLAKAVLTLHPSGFSRIRVGTRVVVDRRRIRAHGVCLLTGSCRCPREFHPWFGQIAAGYSSNTPMGVSRSRSAIASMA